MMQTMLDLIMLFLPILGVISVLTAFINVHTAAKMLKMYTYGFMAMLVYIAIMTIKGIIKEKQANSHNSH